MPQSRIRLVIRRFPENGMKRLLEDPKNIRDLLLLSTKYRVPSTNQVPSIGYWVLGIGYGVTGNWVAGYWYLVPSEYQVQPP